MRSSPDTARPAEPATPLAFMTLTVVREGRGAALWTVTGGKVATDPLGQLTAPEQAALAAEAADVERFLGRARRTRGTRRAPGAREAQEETRPGP